MRSARVVMGPASRTRSRQATRLLAAAIALCVAGTVAIVRHEPARASSFLLRVDAGDVGFLRFANDRWVSDRHYVGGRPQSLTGAMSAAIPEARVYRTLRVGMSAYRLPVPKAGTYRVRLLFAEPSARARGARVFDVTVEGALVLDDFDLFARGGWARSYSVALVAGVTDGFLDLGFARVVGEPVISGIEVVLEATPTATSTTTSPTATTTTAPSTTTTTAAEATTTTTTPLPATSTTTAVPFTTTTTTPRSPSGFPGPANTGVPRGTPLAPSGGITTTHDGQVIDALDVNGSIRVLHDNVTVRRTRVRNPGGEAVWQEPSRRGLVVEDCELDGSGNATAAAAVAFANYTIRRCDVHHFGEGLSASGNTVIENTWLHDFVDYVAAGAHQDVIQVAGGSNVVIRHNTMDMNVDGANAVVMLGTSPGSNIVIDGNWLAGGGFAVYGGSSNGYTGVRITNNRFSRKYYPGCGYHGPVLYGETALLAGNVWDDTGIPLGP